MAEQYTKGELKLIRQMHAKLAPIEAIAAALKRKPDAIAAKIKRMELPKRDTKAVLFVNRYGPEVLHFGKTAKAIKAGFEKQKRRQVQQRQKLKKLKSKLAIDQLEAELKGGADELDAIRRAHAEGAGLTEIGKVVGLTKQGVSWRLTRRK